MKNDTVTQNASGSAQGKNQFRVVIFFGLMTVFFSISPFLSLFSLVPLVYAFYKYGVKVFVQSSTLFLVVILSISLFTSDLLSGSDTISQEGLIDTEYNSSVDVDSTQNFDIEGIDPSTMDFFSTLQSVQRAFSNFMNSPRYIFFDFILRMMRVLGLGFLLYFSAFSWKVRLSLGTVLVTIGMLLAFLVMSQDEHIMNTFRYLNASEENVYALITDIFLLITPVTNAVFLMFNMFTAYLFLCVRAKVNVQNYINYVFLKLLEEVREFRIFIPLGFLAAGYVSNLSGDGGWNRILYMLFMGIALFCALVHIVQGCVYCYFSLSRRIAVHPVWYFFGNCIIMVIPFANISIAGLYLMMGLLYGFRKQKQMKLKEKEYEDNS